MFASIELSKKLSEIGCETLMPVTRHELPHEHNEGFWVKEAPTFHPWDFIANTEQAKKNAEIVWGRTCELVIKNPKEVLSDMCHKQWSGWMEYLFSKCEKEERFENGKHFKTGNLIIPKWAVDRWERQVATKYKNLSEEEKNSDREEAKKFLTFLNIMFGKRHQAIDAPDFWEFVEQSIKE